MNTMAKISYGLFVLTVRDGEIDNGCIINTAMQTTVNPVCMTVTVDKSNYTHDLLMKTKKMNVSILSEKASFELFERFGFVSGRDSNKFADFTACKRAENGILYLTRGANACISAEVTDCIDMGTHTMFIANVTEQIDVSRVPSATYAYYHKNIKPQPEKKGWVCKICNYVYEGEVLPEDYICPLCKHGIEDFVKL